MKIFSIVGTDTEIGKTYATVEILNYLNNNNHKAIALKPIAAGLDNINGKLINEDVYRISSANHSYIPNEIISPLQLKLAIAPHIAAQYQQVELNTKMTIEKIKISINAIKDSSDYILIEGIGGIMVPLNQSETYINVLEKLSHPVILVIGMKLGCLNHALLTYNALLANNIEVLGWIANCIAPNMPYLSENIKYLEQSIKYPLIAIIPHNNKMEITPNFKKVFHIAI